MAAGTLPLRLRPPRPNIVVRYPCSIDVTFSSHAWRGTVTRFPTSRFLVAQMASLMTLRVSQSEVNSCAVKSFKPRPTPRMASWYPIWAPPTGRHGKYRGPVLAHRSVQRRTPRADDGRSPGIYIRPVGRSSFWPCLWSA